MRLIIIRHAEAEDRAASGRDSDRALTEKGKKMMHDVARGLRSELKKVDVVVASPYTRAHETAQIVFEEVEKKITLEYSDRLTPGADVVNDTFPMLAQLFSREGVETVAVVGHEPHLGLLASRILTGENRVMIDMKKSSVCAIELERARENDMRGWLLWHIVPKVVLRI